jgi:hypothetical protein
MDLTKNGWECHKTAPVVDPKSPLIYIYLCHGLHPGWWGGGLYACCYYIQSVERIEENENRLKFRLRVQFVGSDLLRVIQYVL